jgi:predicted metal-binding membrane protein
VLERQSLLDASMAGFNTMLAAIILIAEGIYQWTPFKSARARPKTPMASAADTVCIAVGTCMVLS